MPYLGHIPWLMYTRELMTMCSCSWQYTYDELPALYNSSFVFSSLYVLHESHTCMLQDACEGSCE